VMYWRTVASAISSGVLSFCIFAHLDHRSLLSNLELGLQEQLGRLASELGFAQILEAAALADHLVRRPVGRLLDVLDREGFSCGDLGRHSDLLLEGADDTSCGRLELDRLEEHL